MGKLKSKKQKSLQTERQNAVDEAWKAEVELVREGKGTRQWTAAEQKELLRTGRVEGYYGHHMQSVKTHPENAGNKDNIQFLSYEEHIKGAHQGNTRNSTNGYYDPETREMHDFINGELSPNTPMNLNEQAFDSAIEREQAYREGLIARFNAKKEIDLARYEKNLVQREDLSDEVKADRYTAMSDKYESEKQDFADRTLGNENTNSQENDVDSSSSVSPSCSDANNTTSDTGTSVDSSSSGSVSSTSYSPGGDSSNSSSSDNSSSGGSSDGASSDNGGGMDY